MSYLWLKILHVTAVIVWIAGVFLAAVAITIFSKIKAALDAPSRLAVLKTVRGCDRTLTLPAMLLVWALGLTMALFGGWFSAPWLMLKIAFVLLLSGLHGLLSGTLRKLARPEMSVAPSILN